MIPENGGGLTRPGGERATAGSGLSETRFIARDVFSLNEACAGEIAPAMRKLSLGSPSLLAKPVSDSITLRALSRSGLAGSLGQFKPDDTDG
jgi:hypothetical protein